MCPLFILAPIEIRNNWNSCSVMFASRGIYIYKDLSIYVDHRIPCLMSLERFRPRFSKINQFHCDAAQIKRSVWRNEIIHSQMEAILRRIIRSEIDTSSVAYTCIVRISQNPNSSTPLFVSFLISLLECSFILSIYSVLKKQVLFALASSFFTRRRHKQW